MNKFGLIGYPLGHSFSKNFFNQKFQSENINAEYVNFEIPTIGELNNILLSNPDLCGLNVTIPYKEQVIPFLDEIDETAKEIGAVNVVKSYVGDPTGDYKYLGEIKKGKQVVSYMFTDDASTEDGAFLAVGTVQYYVVSGVECRFADDEETLWAMRSPIAEILDNPYNSPRLVV